MDGIANPIGAAPTASHRKRAARVLQGFRALSRASSLAVRRRRSVALPIWADELTGLANRRTFRDCLAAALENGAPAVVMVDLDRFKPVNDSLGHPVGDALLCIVAQRLRSAVREEDVVARLGGDEFAVLLRVGATAERLAERIVDLLGRPYLVDGHLVTISASVGVAAGPRDGADATTLIRNADLALLDAKGAGRRTVRVFRTALCERAQARVAMEAELRRAIALRQLEVHYQPQVNLGSGRLVGFEALVRWRHPERGLVPPGEFIPLAEEIGYIVPLGEWVLRAACQEAAGWEGDLTVAVNVSALQLEDGARLLRAVAAALEATGLPGARLEIEITESALARNEGHAAQVLHALRALGVRVSMDDFGNGYSSLSQLRSFPFDKLKLDRSFVANLSESEEAAALVRAIASLGASLGMTTTAEGVETDEQAGLIRANGYTDMQGYLISRPVQAGDVPALIRRLMREELEEIR